MKTLTAFLAITFCLLASASKTHGDPVVPQQLLGGGFTQKVTVTNDTDSLIKGIGLTFDTGGTIENAMLTMNPPGAGAAMISGSGDHIIITWSELGVVPGAQIMFTFTTDVPFITFVRGAWIVEGPHPEIPVDPVRDQLIVQQLPEPSTLLLLATGLAAVAIKRPKRQKSTDRK